MRNCCCRLLRSCKVHRRRVVSIDRFLSMHDTIILNYTSLIYFYFYFYSVFESFLVFNLHSNLDLIEVPGIFYIKSRMSLDLSKWKRLGLYELLSSCRLTAAGKRITRCVFDECEGECEDESLGASCHNGSIEKRIY